MRVLVVGQSGQLARALPSCLARAGFTALAIGRPALDLARPAQVMDLVRAMRPALVVNAAAYTAVDRAEDEADAAFTVNHDGAAALARAAAEIGAAMVQVSTDYVFDGSKGAPYAEDDATAPLGLYGASKLAGEAAVLAANARAVVLRSSWVCSAEGSNFVRTMLRLAATRSEVAVVADQRGAPIFADDLAAAIAAIALRLATAPAGDAGFGVFHLSGAPETTWHGFAAAILAGASARGQAVPPLRAIATADYPTRAKRPADSRLDCTRIAAVHGIAQPDWRPALGRCLDILIGPAIAVHHISEGVAA